MSLMEGFKGIRSLLAKVNTYQQQETYKLLLLLHLYPTEEYVNTFSQFTKLGLF